MNIIETENLTRRFGKAEAVAGLDLAVPQGSICALLGPNGAGKSTTIKLLMNLLQPTAGSARVLGVDSRKLGPREFERIGYVAESQKLPKWMTVKQWVDYCRPFYPQWDATLEKTLMNQFALPPDRKLEHLSRGMLMKAALLTSLSYRPELLVLDEPFSGLDPLVRDEFVRGILEVSALGEWTVLVASHDIEEVERLADRVALLNGGKLRVNESTEELLARYRRVEVTGAPENAEPGSGWIEWERAGALTRFVETGYFGEATEDGWALRFGGAKVEARVMTLREVFLCFARAGRSGAEKKEGTSV
jgi:ABC-2 type transport system ATP-binding protein